MRGRYFRGAQWWRTSPFATSKAPLRRPGGYLFGFFILPETHLSKRRLVILISGRGSNMQALAQACRDEDWPADIAAVIASRPDAGGLEWAAAQGIPTAALYHKDLSLIHI